MVPEPRGHASVMRTFLHVLGSVCSFVHLIHRHLLHGYRVPGTVRVPLHKTHPNQVDKKGLGRRR